MTIDNELTTASINSLSVGSDAGKPVLLVGLKEGYRDKPQYVRSLKREFSQCKDFDHPHHKYVVWRRTHLMALVSSWSGKTPVHSTIIFAKSYRKKEKEGYSGSDR